MLGHEELKLGSEMLSGPSCHIVSIGLIASAWRVEVDSSMSGCAMETAVNLDGDATSTITKESGHQ